MSDISYLPTGLQESELDMFAAVLSATSTGVVITDHLQPDDPIIYCNKAFEDLTGYNTDQIIGHNCRFLQGNDRNQLAREQVRTAVKEHRSIRVELRNYRADGKLFWNDLILSPVKDKEGKVTHFVGIQTDITEKKQAEAALRAEREQIERRVAQRTSKLQYSEEYLSGIVQTIRESLLVLDKDFTVISANPHFYNTFKVSPGETVGTLLFDLGNKQWNIPALRELLEKVLPHSNPFEGFEVSADFPHIGYRNMMVNAYQVQNEGDYKDRILLAFEDVTERKTTDRRKDDFLGIASHELKTPLTSIKAYLQILLEKISAEIPPEMVSILKKAENYTNKLNDLITDLLDVSKIQSGKLEIRKQHFDFDQMVTGVVESFQASTKTHTITLTGNSRSQCMGDDHRLEQVVSNLLTNAIKYSPQGKEVQVHIGRVNKYLKVLVTDMGVGVAKKDHKDIFERFFRVDEIQKSFPGLGVGLYVCDQIIKQHGGTLWVESELGSGSTFSFTVPIN